MAKDGTARGGHTEVWSLLKRLERTTSSIVALQHIVHCNAKRRVFFIFLRMSLHLIILIHCCDCISIRILSGDGKRRFINC